METIGSKLEIEEQISLFARFTNDRLDSCKIAAMGVRAPLEIGMFLYLLGNAYQRGIRNMLWIS